MSLRTLGDGVKVTRVSRVAIAPSHGLSRGLGDSTDIFTPVARLDLADAQEACEAYAAYAQHTLVSTRRALGCRGAPCNQS